MSTWIHKGTIPGSGGSGAPTVVYQDDVGVSDRDVWKFYLPDSVGASDRDSWKFGLPDNVGFSDSAVITARGTPQLVASRTTTAPETNAITIQVPPGASPGDLLLVFVSNARFIASGPSVYSDPPGAFQYGPAVVAHVGTVVTLNLRTFYRVVDGTEGAQYTFTFQANVNLSIAEMHLIRGANTANPFNAWTNGTLSGSSLIPDPVSPSNTTTVNDCLIFRNLSHYHGLASATHLPPASHTERTDTQVNNGTNFFGNTLDTIIKGVAGSTGTATHDCSQTAGTDAVMLNVAIAPDQFVLNL